MPLKYDLKHLVKDPLQGEPDVLTRRPDPDNLNVRLKKEIDQNFEILTTVQKFSVVKTNGIFASAEIDHQNQNNPSVLVSQVFTKTKRIFDHIYYQEANKIKRTSLTLSASKI